MDLPHFGYCQYLGADSIFVKSLYISVHRHFVLSDTERITGYGQLLSSDIERITGHRCLGGSGHGTDHRADCLIRWTNLTVS